MSNSSSNTQRSSSGIGILGLLGVAFVVLKLVGVGAVASWPWLWVLAPFWIPLALVIVILGIVAVVAVVEAKR